MGNFIAVAVLWLIAIVSIIIMHKIRPEDRLYKVWALMQCVMISALVLLT